MRERERERERESIYLSVRSKNLDIVGYFSSLGNRTRAIHISPERIDWYICQKNKSYKNKHSSHLQTHILYELYYIKIQ